MGASVVFRARAVLGIALVLFLSSACGRQLSDREIATFDEAGADERAAMLESDPVIESKRQSYERAVLALEILGGNDEPLSFCTSVLIRPDVILTAGHCFDTNYIPAYRSARIQPTTNLNTAKPDNPRARRVIQTILHPLFDSHGVTIDGKRYTQHDHDLALAILEKPMDPSIVPQALVASNQPLNAGQKVMIYGFGRSVDYNQISRGPYAMRERTLQRGWLTLSGEMLFDRIFSRADSQSAICHGDSGGPGFIFPKKKSGSATIVSINSASMGSTHPMFTARLCKGQSVVQPVAPYREWIDETLKRLGR